MSVKTATSYLSRIWNRNLLEAGEARFKGIARNWIGGQIREMEVRAKAEALDAKPAKAKQDLPEFVSDADRADYVDQVVNDIFNQLTGRARLGAPSYDMTISVQGPMKDRSFNIPDELVEEFLENDIELIARRYARVMSADVELARMSQSMGFSGKPDLSDAIESVQIDYQALRDQVMGSDLSPQAKEKQLRWLGDRERRDIGDIAGVRDILRGQYRLDVQHTNFARVTNAALTFNFMRLLGGVLFSSQGDVVRPVMIHGLARYMGEGIVPLVSNLKAVKMSVEDAKLLGAVTERVLQSRIATMAELADPYAMNSPFERFLRNMANVFTKMTLLPWWNDLNKSIASVLTQNRIIKNALADFDSLPAKEKAYMGMVGVNPDGAARVRAMFDQFGQVEGNVHVANLERWTDKEAVRIYSAAVNKDVDGTIVTKGAGDTPLFMHTPAGRALMQFKSFAIASNQRVLMRGFQEGMGSLATGFVGMAAMGALVYWLKQTEAAREVSDNPGTWAMEGLDRSGILSLAFELNNMWERTGGKGAYWGAAWLFDNKSQQQPASRYASRTAFGALLGPSFQLGTDLVTLGGLGARAVTGNDANPTPGDVSIAVNMIPGRTLPFWRWLFDGGFGLEEGSGFRGLKPEAQEMVQ